MRVRGTLALALACVMGQPAGAAAQAPFFDTDSIATFTIRTDLRTLLRDRHPDSAAWHEGSLTWQAPAGPRTVPVRLRTRGLFRLRHCDFPPLRLRFSESDVRDTPFADLRRPKLVTHCKERGDYRSIPLQEYAIYRAWRLFTPAAMAARLVRITWEDSAGSTRTVTHLGLLTEDPDRLVDRLGGTAVEAVGIRFNQLRPFDAAVLGVFQYLIANTDWSVPAQHNVMLVRVADTLLAVPYDFDWAGVINAAYARPDPRLPIRSVRTRIYRGPCVQLDVLGPVLERFEALRDSITAIYRSVPELDSRTAESSIRYHEEFFRAITDRQRFQQRVVAPDCLRQAL